MAKVEIDAAELAMLKEKAKKADKVSDRYKEYAKKRNATLKLFKEKALAAGIKVTNGEVEREMTTEK